MAQVDFTEMLSDAGFVKIQDIPAEINIFDCDVLVSWDEVGEFGQGSTLEDAMLEFSESIVELCSFLFAAEDSKLGPDLQKIKSTLRQYIVPSVKNQASA